MEGLEKGPVYLEEGREKTEGVKKVWEGREGKREVEPKVWKRREGGRVFRGLRIKWGGIVLGIGSGLERRSVAAGEKIFSRDVGV